MDEQPQAKVERKPLTHVADALAQIEHQVEEAGGLRASLETRLSGVVRPEQDSPPDSPSDCPCRVPLAESLSSLAQTLASYNRRTADLIERIEL